MAFKHSLDKVIEKFKSLHSDRFDYSYVVYNGDRIPIKIKCIKHNHTFTTTPESHKCSNSGGCGFCLKELKQNSATTRKPISEVILEFSLVHGNYYDYSKVYLTYQNAHSKIEVICPNHGPFITSPNMHYKSGCSKCGDESRVKKISGNNEYFILKSIEEHGTIYNYSQVNYINNSTHVNIICPKHGVFSQHPGSHMSGNGCPKCKSSHGEKKLMKFFNEHDIHFIHQYRFPKCVYKKPLPFDFYLPDLNICVEFHGEQHYKPVKLWGGEEYFEMIKIRDQIKYQYCLDNNIKFMVFNQSTIKKMNLHDFVHADEILNMYKQ